MRWPLGGTRATTPGSRKGQCVVPDAATAQNADGCLRPDGDEQETRQVHLHTAVYSVVAVTAAFCGCGGEPPVDRGPRDAAEALSELVKERNGGTLTGVRCEPEIEHEYRCTGRYRDPLLDDPTRLGPLLGALMSMEKDGIPSQSRESAMRQLESGFVRPRRYIARFDPSERAWSYKRLCERCR